MTYIALKVNRFSSKKKSSIVKNLIKFTLMDEILNFADADFVRPHSSKIAGHLP